MPRESVPSVENYGASKLEERMLTIIPWIVAVTFTSLLLPGWPKSIVTGEEGTSSGSGELHRLITGQNDHLHLVYQATIDLRPPTSISRTARPLTHFNTIHTRFSEDLEPR